MSRRLRVGVDFHTFDGIFQGSRSHVLGIYKEAIKQAPDIDFYFFLKDTERLRTEHAEFRCANVKLVEIQNRSGFWRFMIQLPWLQIRYRLNILHTQYRIPLIPVGACACTIHDVLFETHPQYFPRSFVLQAKLTSRHSTRLAAMLFSVSEYSRGEISRLYGISEEEISVTYNGVDHTRFRPALADSECLSTYDLISKDYILSVGRLEPRKNHQTLIRAYARLPQPRPPLVILGQRDFSYAGIYSEVTRLGLLNDVHFLDNVNDNDLPVILRHASLFIFPAFAEGFGMPVAEAMASGVPVIASNTTSIPEVTGGAALLIDPNSEEAITEAIMRMLDDVHLVSKLIEHGIVQAKRFNWGASAQSMIQRYRQLQRS